MADSVKVSLDVATKAAEIALKNFQDETKKADGFWTVFKGNLAANIATGALSAVKDSVIGFFKSSIEAAQKQEDAINKLNTALKLSGNFTEETSKDFQEYATQLQKTTKFGDELILENAALIQSLGQLDREGLKVATTAALDLSSALGIDLTSAATLVGKAAAGEVSSFSRYGLVIQKGATDAETFAKALEAINSKFGGSAAAQVKTFSGALAVTGNAIDDLAEEFGFLITQNPIVIAGLSAVGKAFEGLTGFINENRKDIILFGNSLLAATAIVGAATIGVLAYTGTLGGLATAHLILAKAATVAWAAITGPIGLAIGAIVGVGLAIFAVVKYWDQITIATNEAIATTLEYAAIAAKIVSGSLAKSLNDEAQSFRDKAQATRDALKAQQDETAGKAEAEEAAAKQAESERKLSEAKKAQAEQYKSFADGLIKQSQDINAANDQRIAASEQQASLEQEQLKAQLDNGLINYYDYQLQRDAIDAEFQAEREGILAEQQLAEQERLQQVRDAGLISETDFNKAKIQLDKNYATEKSKIDTELAKKDLKNKQDLIKQEKEFGFAKTQAAANVFGAIADIAALGGEKAFKIAKAFALAEAITAGILSIQKAAASAIPPFNVPAIVSATAFSAANVARLVASKPSFATGGVVGGFQGATLGGDNTQINARTGEMFLNAGQQRNLFDIANGRSGGSGAVESLLGELINVLKSQPIIVNVGGRTVVETLRSELESGRTFA